MNEYNQSIGGTIQLRLLDTLIPGQSQILSLLTLGEAESLNLLKSEELRVFVSDILLETSSRVKKRRVKDGDDGKKDENEDEPEENIEVTSEWRDEENK